MSPPVAVASPADLASALAAAQPGGELVLADGVYPGTWRLEASGTPEAPITLRAAHPGQAVLQGGRLTLAGSHVQVAGVRLEGTPIYITGHHVRLTRSWVSETPYGHHGVSVLPGAMYTRIDHNDIWHMRQAGVEVVLRAGEPIAYGTRIDHNWVHDALPGASNGIQAVGVGSQMVSSFWDVGTLIEYNLFERVEVDAEVISLKSSRNRVRFNTLVDCHASISLRHGTHNAVLGNTLVRTGISVKGEQHRILGNHLVDGAIVLMAGNMTQAETQDPRWQGGFPAARHCLVAGNRFEAGAIRLGRYRSPGHSGSPGSPHPALGITVAGTIGSALVRDEGYVQGLTVDTWYVGPLLAPVRLRPDQVGPDAPEEDTP